MHRRHWPVEHHFTFPYYFYVFDLDELDEINGSVKIFNHNKWNIVSIHDKDYLAGSGSIKEKILHYLQGAGYADGIFRIELVTNARYFGYVFNPVSFYYCYRQDGSVHAVVAEVNNTYGDRHIYILDNKSGKKFVPIKITHGKEFHVSPFNDLKGHYEFSFEEPKGAFRISITLVRDEGVILEAVLSAKASPLTSATLTKTILKYPITSFVTIPRIFIQALKLFFIKRLKFNDRPEPSSAMTIKHAGTKAPRKPTSIEKTRMVIVKKILSGADKGLLEMELPDRSRYFFGKESSGPKLSLRVKDYRFFNRLISSGEIGFGESYTAGEFETDDLVGVISFFIQNKKALGDRGMLGSILNKSAEFIRHQILDNTKSQSRKNIRAHYDLGNEFFQLFLDKNMMYSCAIFNERQESIESAQSNKIDTIITKAGIRGSDHVLEIGSGWGGFAIEAVKRTGCCITTITLSEAQRQYAISRIKEAGLAEKISVQLCDYREARGSFDVIVSIEMLEAVGHQHLPSFFQACERLLKPSGIAVIQTITVPDQNYETYRTHSDWIRKHIFPGGHLSSITAIANAMTVNSDLYIEELQSIGMHYALTLAKWKERFVDNLPQISAQGFDDSFVRKWLYYFSACEAGFRNRIINDVIIKLSRTMNMRLEEPS